MSTVGVPHSPHPRITKPPSSSCIVVFLSSAPLQVINGQPPATPVSPYCKKPDQGACAASGTEVRVYDSVIHRCYFCVCHRLLSRRLCVVPQQRALPTYMHVTVRFLAAHAVCVRACLRLTAA